eukprot:scaffold627901_cov19-Prasinocladus_malaysianus.AAC.2
MGLKVPLKNLAVVGLDLCYLFLEVSLKPFKGSAQLHSIVGLFQRIHVMIFILMCISWVLLPV